MFKNQQVTGIVIASINRGEADRLLTVYSRELGKVKIIARSVRKTASKLYGATGLFGVVEIEFVEGRAIRTMTDYRMVRRFSNIGSDLAKMRAGYEMFEIIDLLVEDEQKDDNIWLLVRKSFAWLESLSTNNNFWLVNRQYFFWNMISLLGYEPDTSYCYSCKKRLAPKDMAFNPVSGGIKCNNCLRGGYARREVKISVDAVKILRLIIRGDRKMLLKIKFKKETEKELNKIMDMFLKYHFHNAIK